MNSRSLSPALVLLLAAWPASAVTIRDTLTRQSGGPWTGYITVINRTMYCGATVIQPGSERHEIVNGALELELQPTSGCGDRQAGYEVRWQPKPTGPSYVTYWAVPASQDPLSLAQVQIQSLPAPSIAVTPSQLRVTISAGKCLGTVDGILWAGLDCFGAQLADQETPSGATDGINKQFNLAHAPQPATSLMLFRNGIVLQRGVDYSITASTIHFCQSDICTPQPGDTLLAWYRY